MKAANVIALIFYMILCGPAFSWEVSQDGDNLSVRHRGDGRIFMPEIRTEEINLVAVCAKPNKGREIGLSAVSFQTPFNRELYEYAVNLTDPYIEVTASNGEKTVGSIAMKIKEGSYAGGVSLRSMSTNEINDKYANYYVVSLNRFIKAIRDSKEAIVIKITVQPKSVFIKYMDALMDDDADKIEEINPKSQKSMMLMIDSKGSTSAMKRYLAFCGEYQLGI